ncbi:MAG: electron transfer flavoprotein subunit beta/FixA family protein [Dethiobacteria bacterium]|jgi:electron transfer flavoprotein beta subunit|nr:electron transfer flavoprotein subunit beta/FixA family protein [Bacillota bacterium]HOB28742.1 electron transfer flavoprotein subunit beta/FixA family protein [Bacillota bacterium]HPZ41430.1 electron transfer flavoprotein subunit beta/FixA family protein [Bacillota bacterium]HQD51697.1 electron transfer flavoprotein subunit beta/FixA family protein [Bacillota bacterium]
MKIFTCIKYVPDTSEAEIKLNPEGTEVDSSRFSFDINDADNYAVEESVLIKEKYGGNVTVVSIGPKESEVMIRMAMAKGCDNAIRIEDERIASHDPLMVARVLAGAIKDQEFDLVLTGCMANDYGQATTGVALAEILGVPHAAYVKKVEIEDGKVKAYRELEGGLMEVVEINLPAVLTIQTGINEPRYAPIRGIRQAQKKELKVVNLDDLGIAEGDVNAEASQITLEKLYIPVVESKAEIIEGEPEEKAEKLASILVKGGLV